MDCWCCVSMCSYVHVLCVSLSLRLSVVGKGGGTGVSIKIRWQCQCSFCSSCSILDIWHHETYLFICCKIISYMTGFVWEHGRDECESLSVLKLLTNPQQAPWQKSPWQLHPLKWSIETDSVCISSPQGISYADNNCELAYFAALLCRADHCSSATNGHHINIETDCSLYTFNSHENTSMQIHTHTHMVQWHVCVRDPSREPIWTTPLHCLIDVCVHV